MTSRQRIPQDLAQHAPGPELAAVLAGVDLSRLSGFDAVEVLAARYRQLSHAQAQYLAALAEVGHCDDPDGLSRVAVPGQFAAEEARAVLVFDPAQGGRGVLVRRRSAHPAPRGARRPGRRGV